MNVPIFFAFATSILLSILLTTILRTTIDTLGNNKTSIALLNYFYWSVNLITISLGYFLFR